MTNRRESIKCILSTAGILTLCPFTASGTPTAQRARFWKPGVDHVKCNLCPRYCEIKPGAIGHCRTRRNDNGSLVTIGYANPCAVHVDPIEKKPLYHVLPGAKAFSIAVAGCNLRCKNCQNYTISQSGPLETPNMDLPPHKVVEKAIQAGCTTIAYTYSEPIVWYEYMYDTAKLARKAGLRNLMITCGYINPEPLKELAKYMDAANMDLKGFDNDIYRKLNAGKLQPVLDAIKLAQELGIWVEITNLIVPEWTDKLEVIRKMCIWIRNTVGKDVPLHFSRFSPMYKLAHLYPTPRRILIDAKKIAREEGLNHVYVGNVAGTDSNTYCPKCRKVLVKRMGYLIAGNKIKNGKCGYCGTAIKGIWN